MSGHVVSLDTKHDLLNACTQGHDKMVFVEKRIASNEIGFYTAIKKMNLKTIASTPDMTNSGKEDLLKTDRDMYA